MYKVSHFTTRDPNKILEVMRQYPFAVVTGMGEDYPVASHLPLQVENREGKFFLSGHMMKETDHYKAFQKNEHVLAIFNGPNSFISASWYTSPLVASTWNYITVHARGKIRFTGEAGTLQAIRDISNKYEGTDSPAAFDKLPADYINKLVHAIAGFEIEVISLDHVFKLSQNNDDSSRLNIISELIKKGDDQSIAIADAMREEPGTK